MSEKPTYEELEQRVQELERARSECRNGQRAPGESEELYRKLIDFSPLPFLVTQEETIVFSNPAAVKLLGTRDSKEIIGSSPTDWIHPDFVERAYRRRRHIIQTGEAVDPVELTLLRRDKKEAVVLANATRITHHESPALLSIFHDITERKEAEEAIESQRAQLKSLFDYSGEAIALLDMENHILEANSGFERIFGYSPEEARGNVIEDLICPERFYFKESKELDKKSLTGIKGVELIRKRKNGKEIHVRASAGPIAIEGRLLGRFVVFDDITDQKQAEQALRDSERYNRGLIQALHEDILVIDRDYRITDINDRALQTFGLSREEAIGRRCHELSHGRDRPCHEHGETCGLLRVFETGEVRNLHHEHVGATGEFFHVDLLFSPLKDETGRVTHVIEAARDVTDLFEAQKAVAASEARMKSIFGASPIGIGLVSDRVLLEVNDRLCRITGYSRDELIARNARILYPSDEEYEHVGNEKYRQIRERGTGTIETRFRTKGGEILDILLRSAPIDTADLSAGITFTALDITGRKRAEEEREKLQAQLNQAQKMEAIGTLAGGIAHDFNNILSIIVGNAELAMLDLPEWSPAQDTLNEIREATLRARELVKQILLFARQKEHTVSNLRLEPVVKESLKMLRASIPTTVEIREDMEESLPSVLADPSQIQQIIMNLCTNAGQVMEAEGGTLTFTLDRIDLETPLPTVADELPPGLYVRMRVRDTGPGIPSGIRERIFDPFFTTKGVGEGTGLGLAVVHGIVLDRNGGVTVESEDGLGTTFSIYLPASEVEHVEVTAEQKRELPRGTERILFVDDEPMILKLGRRMLERQGYRVETRAGGMDALEYFRQDPHRFDLVMTDMTMPGMRGDRLAEEILAIRADIPLILCTGYSRQISKEKAREIGIRAFVMKPLTQHELVNTVRRVLDETPRK